MCNMKMFYEKKSLVFVMKFVFVLTAVLLVLLNITLITAAKGKIYSPFMHIFFVFHVPFEYLRNVCLPFVSNHSSFCNKSWIFFKGNERALFCKGKKGYFPMAL